MKTSIMLTKEGRELLSKGKLPLKLQLDLPKFDSQSVQRFSIKKARDVV